MFEAEGPRRRRFAAPLETLRNKPLPLLSLTSAVVVVPGCEETEEDLGRSREGILSRVVELIPHIESGVAGMEIGWRMGDEQAEKLVVLDVTADEGTVEVVFC